MTAADRIVDRLRAAPARQRAALLMEYLRGQIADRLLVEPSAVEPRGQLMALGMTSLQAVELKIELETQLSPGFSEHLPRNQVAEILKSSLMPC